MRRIIEKPADTLDENYAYIWGVVMPSIEDKYRAQPEVLKEFRDVTKTFSAGHALWAAIKVLNTDTCHADNRRAACLPALDIRIQAEKIIAQACPPVAAGAAN